MPAQIEFTKWLATDENWLAKDEVAALSAQQLLEPVETGGVIFPPTFAAEDEGKKGGYNIDVFNGGYKATIDYGPPKQAEIKTEITHESGRNVCLIDSVGAEANRIEPLFKPNKCEGRYSGLVPQVVIRAGSRTVNLLDAGHRAGDAIIRFTKFGETVFEAFKALNATNNAEPLAKCAPTSLVFGVWDSRGSQEKVPRAFRSVIRAYNVVPLTRSAQYNRATKYVEYGLVPEELDKGSGDNNPLSREGFKDNPATGSHGGVLVGGDIRRDMTINLTAIRRLRVPKDSDPTKDDPERTLKLRRYILGLVLVAATARCEDKYNLREGCQLKQKGGHKPVWRVVSYEGEDVELTGLTEDVAAAYADAAAKAFGVENFPEFEFDQKAAEKWLRLDKKQQDKLRRDKPMTQQFAGDAGEGAQPEKSKPAKPKGGK
jgi:CRISPR-associated protein Csb1